MQQSCVSCFIGLAAVSSIVSSFIDLTVVSCFKYCFKFHRPNGRFMFQVIVSCFIDLSVVSSFRYAES